MLSSAYKTALKIKALYLQSEFESEICMQYN